MAFFPLVASIMWEQTNYIIDKIIGGMTRGSVLKENYVLEKKIQSLNNPTLERAQRLLPSPESPLFSQFYELREKFNMGAHGELWRIKSFQHKGSNFVAKRLFVEKSNNIRLSGLREIFFGKRLKNLDNVARYEEHFTLPRFQEGFSKVQSKLEDLWIIFRDEGLSLQSYLYETRHMITTPSPFWRRLRLQHDGQEVLREIVKQLLTAVKGCHSLNVAHRDIKPGNLIINSNEFPPKLRLADFGSAVVEMEATTEDSTGFLYDEAGPSQNDETTEYMPPEVKLSDTLPYARRGTRNAIAGAKQYDMWSIGVVWLEILLASKNPFEINDKEKTIIKHRLSRQGITNKIDIERAFFMKGLAEWGIFNPTHMKVVPISSGLSQDGRATSAIVSTANHVTPSYRMERRTSGETSQNSLINSQQLAIGSSVIAEETSNAMTTIVDAINHQDSGIPVIHSKPHDETCTYANAPFGEKEPSDQNPAFAAFKEKLKQKDPLGRGLKRLSENPWGVKLLWRLLQMRPDDRLSAADALSHVYFRDKNNMYKCHSTGKVYEFARKLLKYCPNNPRADESESQASSNYPMPQSFKCPTCGRHFSSWASCNAHMLGRRHHISKEVARVSEYSESVYLKQPRRSLFCQYNSVQLPPCEVQPGFGLRHHHLWHNGDIGTFDSCGVQGRRMYMEDFFSVDSGTFISAQGVQNDVDMYGVFDGHLGKFVAKFLVSSFLRELKRKIGETCHVQTDALSVNCIKRSLNDTFAYVDRLILDTLWEDNKSGSTGTVLLRVKDKQKDSLIVGSVGDSRAVLCCERDGTPIQMSIDHKPNIPREKERIEKSGGFIEKRGVWRVQGHLAISRSFGDKELKLRHFLISVPSIQNRSCSRTSHDRDCMFMILATDGLWDVVNNMDAVGIVWNSLKLFGPSGMNNRHEFCHNSSKALAQEAYVRDSRDNIGVMVIALW